MKPTTPADLRRAGRYCLQLFLLAILAPAVWAEAPPAAPQGLCVTLGAQRNCAPAAPGTGNKWHPGHYMLVYKNAPQSDFDIIFDEPNIKGAQVRYTWKELEPRKGVYDFSRIESDLAYLQARNKRLVIQILDRNFNAPNGQYDVLPSYMTSDPVYDGGVVYAAAGGGWIARIWDPVVMDRYIALVEALGKRFNSEPFVEAITTEETAPAFGTTVPADYSRNALATQIKRAIAALRGAFPNTVVLQYANYLGSEIDGIVAAAHRAGAGIGGPDTVPGRPTTAQTATASYAGKMPLGFAVQSPELCGKEGCHLPEDIYHYAVNTLKTNYIFWLRFGTNKDTATEKYSFRHGMLPVINANGGHINPACPENIGTCRD